MSVLADERSVATIDLFSRVAGPAWWAATTAMNARMTKSLPRELPPERWEGRAMRGLQHYGMPAAPKSHPAQSRVAGSPVDVEPILFRRRPLSLGKKRSSAPSEPSALGRDTLDGTETDNPEEPERTRRSGRWQTRHCHWRNRTLARPSFGRDGPMDSAVPAVGGSWGCLIQVSRRSRATLIRLQLFRRQRRLEMVLVWFAGRLS